MNDRLIALVALACVASCQPSGSEASEASSVPDTASEASGVGEGTEPGEHQAPGQLPIPSADPVPAASSDAFDGDALDPRWTVLNGETTTIEVRDGALWMRPNEYTLWFHGDRGPAVVQLVEGDFKISTAVRARSARRPDQPVDSFFQFAGLIARDPASDLDEVPENYVFSVVGWRGEYLSAETKNTVNDLSMVDGPPWPSGDAEIRICRIGPRFQLYIREIGADAWQPAIEYSRPDLPDTLQVGAIAYTYTQTVDLLASFDHIDLAPVANARDCTAD